MQTILIAGIDISDLPQDIRYPEDLGFKQTDGPPSTTHPTLVLVHTNDLDQDEVETYRLFLAWEVYLFADQMIPFDQLMKISTLLTLYDPTKVQVPDAYARFLTGERKYGIYSVASDWKTPPTYYA